MNILQTENLSKKFGNTAAVNNVSINVREGEIYGFLGLNGAGKTTTIRLLLGMIKPDSGSFTLFGKHVKQGSIIWNNIGYLVETPHSYPELTIEENLKVVFRLRHLDNKRLIDIIIDKLKLTPYKNKKVKYLSMGNNQRLGLAKALMHKPRLLILDEPINGLDPAGIVEIRELLKELVTEYNTTIFLSSHILSEISKIATRIGIVHEGKLVKEINTNDLEQQVIKKLCLKTLDNSRALQLLKDHGLDVVLNSNDLIETTDINSIQHPETVAALLAESHLPPKMLNVFEEDLESYFLRIIGNEKSLS